MISLLRGLMSSDADTNRPLLSLILLGIFDFVCVLNAAELYKEQKFVTGTWWLIAGIAFSVIGYYWQQIKQKAGDWLVASGARLQKKNKAAGQLLSSPKLVIHRAVYAAGLMTEVSVTDKLNNATRDALVVVVHPSELDTWGRV